jgi:hypothetical protein
MFADLAADLDQAFKAKLSKVAREDHASTPSSCVSDTGM